MTVAAEPRAATLLAEPHHDGSDAYVVERPEQPGDRASVRLRTPRGSSVDAVALRYVHEGESRLVPAVVDEESDAETWWRASFPVAAPATAYRWLLDRGDLGYAYLNGLGVTAHDVTDADDFVLAPGGDGPDWHLRSVVYEIFPDRFASSGLDVDPPDWAARRRWDSLPGRRGRTAREWFGGDLRGVERRLDHVDELGANAIYLTPFFPAGSTHRYDATTFDRVDPLLGGDEALASLIEAARRRGMRVLGDLTTNHTGVGHEWFLARKPYYYYDEALPDGYASWLGVPSLPKLDWTSAELRERMRAVARRWLDFGLDGWRIDVANMTGRYDGTDLTTEVARLLRSALEADEILVGEYFQDFRRDLRGDGWHGVMNYAGFLRPVWSWLGTNEDVVRELAGTFPRVAGVGAVAAMRAFRCGLPWTGVLHSWILLDSHDTARFRTVAGSRERHVVAIGLQMTTPGVPMIFAGDEIGLEGTWAENGRRTMPWDSPEAWDTALLEEYRRLIALRRSSPALARGGIRYAHVGADALCYLREAGDERLLCLAARAPHDPIRVPFRSLETLVGGDAEDGVLPAGGPAFHVWRLH